MMGRAASAYNFRKITASWISNAFDPRMLALSALFICLSCTDRSASELARMTSNKNGVATYEGPITPNSVEKFIAMVGKANKSVNRLDITSPGGDAISGMQFGRFIREKRINVRVVGYCVSSCAQYVFMAARRRELANKSVVLFHSSPKLLKEVYLEAGRPSISRLFDPGAIIEEHFYKDIGVEFDSAFFGRLGLRPVCLAQIPNLSESDPNKYILATRFSVYAMSKSVMNGMGIFTQGFWPNDVNDIRRIVKNLPFKSSFSVSMIDQLPELSKHSSSGLPIVGNSALPTC